MFFRRCAGEAPKLLKPLVKVFFCYSAQSALLIRRLAVTTWLSLHQNKFDIVLDDRIWFVRLSEKLGAIVHFI